MFDIFQHLWVNITTYTTEDLKNVTSSILSVGALILGVLSYLQARKSLFSPKTTEVFKLQLSEYRNALEFLNKETFVSEFRHVIVYNLRLLAMDYQIAVGQINAEKRIEVIDSCLSSTVTREMNVNWSGVAIPSIDDWSEHQLDSIKHCSTKLNNDLFLLDQVESSLFIDKAIKNIFHEIQKEYLQCLTTLYHLLHDYKETIKDTIDVKNNNPVRTYWVDEIEQSFHKSPEHRKLISSLKTAKRLIDDEIKIDKIMK